MGESSCHFKKIYLISGETKKKSKMCPWHPYYGSGNAAFYRNIFKQQYILYSSDYDLCSNNYVYNRKKKGRVVEMNWLLDVVAMIIGNVAEMGAGFLSIGAAYQPEIPDELLEEEGEG